MIIVDNALKAREQQGKPIRVAMVGAGFMGQGLTNQITHSVPGMRMAAVYNRRPERAQHVFRYSGLDRSEEHTSELQSQSNLVCRLLLEKKKQIVQIQLAQTTQPH